MMKNKLGFTLAEIMIVLTIIGVITGILLPIAHNSLPNEKVMKFKKGHATLYKVINELVTSDKYYLDGDLGVKADGSLIDGEHTGDNTYLCQTFADNLATKSVNCKDVQGGLEWFGECSYVLSGCSPTHTLSACQSKMDEQCKEAQNTVGEEIITSDGITFYDANPITPYSITDSKYREIQGLSASLITKRYFKHASSFGLLGCVDSADKDMLRIYKAFCMDVDGINQGEDPFGYGIRIDGKIINGQRAQEWLEKDIQDKD